MSKYSEHAHKWRIVEGDNFGGDYPNEKFVNIAPVTKEQAQKIADAINEALCNHDHARRFWRVEDVDYRLQPGFEP